MFRLAVAGASSEGRACAASNRPHTHGTPHRKENIERIKWKINGEKGDDEDNEDWEKGVGSVASDRPHAHGTPRHSSLLLASLELSDTNSMSLKYEPSSEPLHIYVK